MLLDSQLTFVSLVGQSMVGGAGINIASAITLDLLGQGVGTAPGNIIGNAATFGEDPGVGYDPPKILVTTGAAFTTANGCTLNVAVQYAPDLGAGGNYQPGAWTTASETGPLPVAGLTAATVIARLDLAPAQVANIEPRYIRLLFQVPAAENFTAGTIAYAGVVLARDDQSNKYTSRNYTVA